MEYLFNMTTASKYQQFLLQSLAKRRSKSKGFTLVELMIVVAIIGILVALLLPQLLENRQRANAQSVISTIDTFAKQCSVNMLNENPNDIVVGAVLTPSDLQDTAVNSPAVVGPPQTKACGTVNATTGLFTNAGTAFANTNALPGSQALNGLTCGKNTDGTPMRYNNTDFFGAGASGDIYCVYQITGGGTAVRNAAGITVAGTTQTAGTTPVQPAQVTGYWSTTALTLQ